jgi:integrase
MEHLQKYVNDLRAKPIFSADEKRVEGYSFNYTKRILAPLKSAATWGAENFPGVFFDIGRGVKVPQDRNRNLTNARPAFTFSEVADFIFWLSGQENGWRILPGVALQGLAGLRVTEAHRLTWDRLDFAEGTLAIEGRTKNAPSVRLIPLPAFLLDILGEARERNRMRSEDSAWSESQRWNLLNRVVVSQEWKRGFSDYGREVGRYLRKWQSGCLIEPKGLRRTIFAEADRLGFLGQTLERYVGHSIKGISAVTFAHYLPLDLTAQVALMRERIVVHADAALSDHRERWNARAGSNVIPFQAASGGS